MRILCVVILKSHQNCALKHVECLWANYQMHRLYYTPFIEQKKNEKKWDASCENKNLFIYMILLEKHFSRTH